MTTEEIMADIPPVGGWWDNLGIRRPNGIPWEKEKKNLENMLGEDDPVFCPKCGGFIKAGRCVCDKNSVEEETNNVG